MEKVICKKEVKSKFVKLETFIPYALVVDILEFLVFILEKKSGIKDLFGYFRKDWTKRIYQIYTSVSVPNLDPPFCFFPYFLTRNFEIIQESNRFPVKSFLHSRFLRNVVIVAQKIPDEILSDISHLNNVSRLFLGGMEFSLEEIQNILKQKMKPLHHLRIDNCQREHRILDCSEMDVFKVQNSLIVCKFNVVFPSFHNDDSFFDNRLLNLKQLIFQFCSIDNRFLLYISECRHIEYVQFGDSELDNIDSILSNNFCQRVKKIGVSNCWIKGKREKRYFFSMDRIRFDHPEKFGMAFFIMTKQIIRLINELEHLFLLELKTKITLKKFQSISIPNLRSIRLSDNNVFSLCEINEFRKKNRKILYYEGCCYEDEALEKGRYKIRFGKDKMDVVPKKT